MADDFWYEMLKKQAEQDQRENLQPQAEPQSRGDRKPGKASPDWHLLYHLALNYMARGRNREAESCFIESIRQKENAWSRYGLASLLCLEGREYERAVSVMEQGLMERAGDFLTLRKVSGFWHDAAGMTRLFVFTNSFRRRWRPSPVLCWNILWRYTGPAVSGRRMSF